MPRILVIDDEKQVRTMLRRMLERAGYDVIEAPNGKIGIDLYRNEPTDLVITDLIMPEKEGVETILELKRDFPDVKIIAISGGGRIGPEDYLKMVEQFGVTTFSKPFDRAELLDAVSKMLATVSADSNPT